MINLYWLLMVIPLVVLPILMYKNKQKNQSLVPQKPLQIESETTTLLRGARSLVQAGWIKGDYRSTSVDGSVSYCLSGALEAVYKPKGFDPKLAKAYLNATSLLLKITGSASMWQWNDKWWRTKRSVLRALDRAIALSEKESS